MCWQIKYCCWPGVPAIPLTRGRYINPARLPAHNVAKSVATVYPAGVLCRRGVKKVTSDP
ncbi:hypothetical protein PILCRDRAFT_817539 [Piloderma croceum F 1598]|uniref:Uncharacterized protein n=1 Tax=Piloderma croceum (strain F 1598) TaxID=765440 RepID=A0A0C3G4B7_PILCF|nr:hypothetical protein PILCRDRAFT_817539 [Piloderma croceum F 1598]